MNIKKEITIGQLIVVILALLSSGAFAWTTYGDYQRTAEKAEQIERQVPSFANKETVNALQEDIRVMRNDIADIKSLVTQYIIYNTPSINGTRPSKKMADSTQYHRRTLH